MRMKRVMTHKILIRYASRLAKKRGLQVRKGL